MKTIQEMAKEVRLDIYGCGWPPDKFIERIEAFAALVEAPLRSDIEELLQENTLLRARNDRLEAQSQRKPPLTDEEHDKLMRGRSTLNYGRAVEAAHGIKE